MPSRTIRRSSSSSTRSAGSSPVVGHGLGRRLVDRAGHEAPPREPGVAEVQRNPVQPVQGRDVQAQGVAVLIGTCERVLQDFLRSLPITGQPVGRPIDGVAVPGEELLEGVEIVGLNAPHQRSVVLPDGLRLCASRSVVRGSISVRADRGPRGLSCLHDTGAACKWFIPCGRRPLGAAPSSRVRP